MAANLELIIRAIDQSSGPIGNVNKSLDSFGGKAKLATAAVAGLAGGALGAGLGILGDRALKLDSAMAQFAATAGLTDTQTKALESSVISLSKAHLQSQTDIVGVQEALVNLQGISADNVDEVTRLTNRYLDFATATGQQAPQAVKAFDDILDAWNLTADDAAILMDKLIVSHREFGTSISGAQTALNTMAPAFQALSLSVDDSLGFINLFAASGIDAEATTMAFNKAVSLLTDKTDASQKKLGEMAGALGLTGDAATAFFAMDPGGQFDVLVQKIGALEDPALRASVAIDLFGARGGAKLADALAMSGGSMDAFAVSADEAAGAAEEAANRIEGSFTNKLKLLGNQIMGRAQELTTSFGPALLVVGTMGPQVAGGLSAATAAMLGLNAAMLLNPFVLAGVAIVALIAILVALELKFKFVSGVLLPMAKKAFDDLKKAVGPTLVAALETLKQGWDDLKPAIEGAKDAAKAIGQVLDSTVVPVLEKVGKFLTDHPVLLIALAVAIGLLVAPWLVVIGTIVLVLAKWDEIKRMFTETIPGAITSVIKKIEELPIIGDIFKAVMDFIKLYVETAFATIKFIVTTTIDVIAWLIPNVLVPAFNAAVWVIKNVLVPVFEAAFTAIKFYVETAITVIKWVIDNVLIPAFSAIKWVVDTVVIPAFNTIKWFIDTVLIPAFNTIKDFINNDLIPVFNTVAGVLNDTVVPAVDGVKDAFNTAKNAAKWLIDKVNDLIDVLKKIPKPGDILPDMPGVPVPGIQHGGRILQSGMAVVGEAGPELVRLSRGAEVFSNAHSQRILQGHAAEKFSAGGAAAQLNLASATLQPLLRVSGAIVRATEGGLGEVVDAINRTGSQIVQTLVGEAREGIRLLDLIRQEVWFTRGAVLLPILNSVDNSGLILRDIRLGTDGMFRLMAGYRIDREGEGWLAQTARNLQGTWARALAAVPVRVSAEREFSAARMGGVAVATGGGNTYNFHAPLFTVQGDYKGTPADALRHARAIKEALRK